MSHRNAVTVSQSDSIACFDFLTINRSEILILVVAKYSFHGTIGKLVNGNRTMLTAHITIRRFNLSSNSVELSMMRRCGWPVQAAISLSSRAAAASAVSVLAVLLAVV